MDASDLANRMATAGIASPLGQTVVYAGAPIRGVLHRRMIDVLGETGTIHRTEQVDLAVRRADVATPAAGDIVVVAGSTWTVASAASDGQGAWRLSLRAA